MPRLLKQFLYGTFYLAVFGLIGWYVYSIALQPAPSCFDNRQNGNETAVDCGGDCESCATKNLLPLQVSAAQLFSNNGSYSASTVIKNPNQNLAIKNFDYQFDFYDSGSQLLKSVANKSFLYAGEEKNITEARVAITNGISTKVAIKVAASSLVLEKASEFSQPNYELSKDIKTALDSENNRVLVSGSISNPANFNISKVNIGAFLLDKLGRKIAVSKTALQNLGPFGIQDFNISILVKKELLSEVDLNVTKVFVEILK